MTNLCKTIGDYTETGVIPLLYSIRDCVPIAFPALLIVIFFVLFAGQYFIIKNKTGRARVIIALTSSSFATMVLGMFLLLIGLITYQFFMFWVLLLIISFIILMVGDRF